MRGVKKVLVPTDLSENSRRGVRYALSLAAENGAELLVLHVAREFQAWELYPDEMGFIDRTSCRWTVDRVVQEATLDLHRFLERHLDEVRRVSAVRKRVVLGDVVRQITEVAQGEQSDLIVMAPQPYGSLRRFLFGSTTDRVAREAPCPVLTVSAQRPSTPPRGKPVPPVMWPVLRKQTGYSISVAKANRAELIVFHATRFPLPAACPCEAELFCQWDLVHKYTVEQVLKDAD